MKKPAINELMNRNWYPKCERVPDGGFVIQIPALSDFTVFGDTEEEAWGDYLEALESHLLGYLAANKLVPFSYGFVYGFVQSSEFNDIQYNGRTGQTVRSVA